MGMNSISYMTDKINNENLRTEVDNQYNDYKKITDKIENMMVKSDSDLEEISAKDKAMGWTSVKLNTAIDYSTFHLSEMLMQGTFMGVIEGVKLSNQNVDLEDNTKNFL